MLLFKIPMEHYQEIMAHFHHDAPLEEANKIRVQAESLQQRDSSGKNLSRTEGDGIEQLDKPLPAPIFQG
jgi:hypothetical protein